MGTWAPSTQSRPTNAYGFFTRSLLGFGNNFAPPFPLRLFRPKGDLAAITCLFRSWMPSAGSTPFGQTAEQVPAKWHLQTPCWVSTRSSLSSVASSLASSTNLSACARACGPGKSESVELVGHAELQSPHFMQYVNWTNE